MLQDQARYVLRRERSGGYLFDRQEAHLEKIGEGHYILLERAHNLGSGASGVRSFVSKSFADERNAEAFLGDCVRRGILDENKASAIQIINLPLPAERLPLECTSAPNRLFFRIADRSLGSSPSDANDISLEKAKQYLKQVAEAGSFELWITGGEPTNHPLFLGIVAAAKKYGLYVTVETHGVFDESMRGKLLDSLVDRFAVTIAGGAKAHNELYGEGSYKKMLEFLSRLAQRREKPIILMLPLFDFNIDMLQDAVGTAKAVRCAELMVFPAGGNGSLKLDDFADAISSAADLAEGLGVRISTPCDLVQSNGWIISGCQAGISEAYLDQYGNLHACAFCNIGTQPLGNISQHGYVSLWLDSSRFSMYREDSPGCEASVKLFK